MLRKIQIGSYFLMLVNLFQIVLWLCGGYGRNGIITIPTPTFFCLNIFFPLIILIISIVMVIKSPKKLLSIIIIPFTLVQMGVFIFIILIGVLLF